VMLWGAVKEDPVIGWGSGVEEVRACKIWS